MENGNNVWHRQTALLSSRTGDSSTFRWNSPPSASIRRRIEWSLEFSLPLHRTGASGIGCRGFDRFTGGGRLAWSREHRCRENGFRLVGSLLLSSRPRRGRLAATVYSVFLEFNELAVIKGPGTKVAAGVQRRSRADRPPIASPERGPLHRLRAIVADRRPACCPLGHSAWKIPSSSFSSFVAKSPLLPRVFDGRTCHEGERKRARATRLRLPIATSS